MSIKQVGRALFASVLAITLTPVLGANPAYACSCISQTDRQALKGADVVFKGKIVERIVPAAQQSDPNAGPVVYIFDPVRVYKGVVKVDNQRIKTGANSALCGVDIDGVGPYLVFADKKKNGKLTFNLCGGTRRFKDRAHDFGPGTKA
ncbi:MAG: hypothetical protein ACT4PP_15510 [Sporichthyaceae bacterium]